MSMRFPLSQAQKRIWYEQKKCLNSPLFNIGGTVYISGRIDLMVLTRAIRQVIKNNTALMVRIEEENGQVYQYMEEEIEVGYLDYSKKQNAKELFIQWCRQEFQKPFSVQGHSLYQFKVIQLPENTSAYFVKLHHIIADGWSVKLLTDQIVQAYEAIVSHRFQEVPQAPSYQDYIQDEIKYLASGMFQEEKEYWLNQVLEISENASVSAECLAGQRASYHIEKNLYHRMTSYLKKHGISLNTFILCVYLIYEYKKNGKRDKVVGLPLLGRKGKNERQTIGTFTNTMPYQFTVKPEERIFDMIERIQTELADIYRNQKYPYNLLVEEMRHRGKSVEQLYDVCVNNYNTTLRTELAGNGLTNEEYYCGVQNYALQIIIRGWNGDGLQLDYDYQRQAYSSKQIEKLNTYMMILFQEIFDEDMLKIKDLLLLTKEEKNQILYGNNKRSDVPMDMVWVDLFTKCAKEHGGQIAISMGEKQVDYTTLDSVTDSVAGYLQRIGVNTGDVVIMLPKHNIESVIIIIGIMKSGGVYLPIDESTPTGRINEIISNSEARYVILDKMRELDFSGTYLLMDEIMKNQIDHAKKRKLGSSDMAYMIYTSGSTGRSKGVMITHHNLMNYLCWAKEQYIKKDHEIFALYSSFAFDFTMTSIFLPLISNGEIRIYGSHKSHNVFDDILRENKATIVKITPSHIALIQTVHTKCTSIHAFIIGGENLRTNACNQLDEIFEKKVTIYNEYGPTEATIGCMIHQFQQDQTESIPIGVPISNVQIYLLDGDLNPVPEHTIGELFIGGDSLSIGYVNNEMETNKRFLSNPYLPGTVFYKTGDLAYRTEEGLLIFYSRNDSEVKIRGNRIDLLEIENRIRSSGLVNDVIVKVNQKKESTILSAYIIKNKNYKEESLIQYLNQYLLDYMIPDAFLYLDHYPLTINGKVDTNALLNIEIEQKHLDGFKAREEHILLLQVIRNQMKDDKIQLEDNFYAIGGDSIRAIQIAACLNEKGYEITVNDILRHPYLIHMATCMKKKTVSTALQDICCGEIKKSPIITWFVEQKFLQEGRYNHICILQMKKDISLDDLNAAFAELIRHHDSLRINYNRETDTLYYNNAHLHQNNIVRVIHRQSITEEEYSFLEKEWREHVFQLKEELLIRPYLVYDGDDITLNIVVHHLIIDGVSWRILLEDLSRLLMKTSSQKAPQLPEKTVSYQDYMQKLSIWMKHCEREDHKWEYPISREEECSAEATYGQAHRIQIRLDTELTALLLGRVNLTYHTTVNDILLIALIRVMQKTSQTEKMFVEVESHGRDLMRDVDINRSIGWFTIQYPIQLVINEANISEQIKLLKEQIRQAYKRRYAKSLPKQAKIRFNYLGSLEEWNPTLFTMNQMIFDIHPLNQLLYHLDVNAAVMKNQCVLDLIANQRYFSIEAIKQLAEHWKEEIILLIHHCCSITSVINTPSDFELVDMTQEEIDYLMNESVNK